ncbi:MAG TPA: bacteriocin fulvocin C-related protein [Gemmatimonadales bacterium]
MTTSVRLVVIALSVAPMAQVATRVQPGSSSQPSCVVAHNWVQTHWDALPTSYDAYTAYPVAWQKAIYAALGPSERVSLWQTHLDRVMAIVDLTAEQRSFLASAKESLSPIILRADQGAAQELATRAEQVMGRDLTRIAFYDVGDLEKASSASSPDCSCSSNSECAQGHICRSGDCAVAQNCGAFHLFDCTGLCYSPE